MFKKITKNIINTAKTEINTSVDAQIPIIIGAFTLFIAILSFMDDVPKEKKPDVSTVTINNYYF